MYSFYSVNCHIRYIFSDLERVIVSHTGLEERAGAAEAGPGEDVRAVCSPAGRAEPAADGEALRGDRDEGRAGTDARTAGADYDINTKENPQRELNSLHTSRKNAMMNAGAPINTAA